MTFDVILVGGGLHNALIALAVLHRKPEAALALVERADDIGGNHTWSFHAGDLSPGMEQVCAGVIDHRWPAYSVCFPNTRRRIARPYASITSTSLRRAVRQRFQAAPNARLLLSSAAVEITPGAVGLEDGRVLAAPVVIDARGPESKPSSPVGAVQKFLGLELELSTPSALTEPIVMDAEVEQVDGFRFVYTLPFSPTRVLVEDTYYSESALLDVPRLRERALTYAQARGMRVTRILREERGVLPLPLAWRERGPSGSPWRAGYAGGWFHPTTGYSFPCAARLAEQIAQQWPAPPQAPLERLWAEHARQARFFVCLNRLMFRAFSPEQRWRPLERFHQLSEDTIERFYAMTTTRADRARILVGRPPKGVRLGRALVEFAGGRRRS